jgi:polar amino acid transport system substrate-binding protein
MRICVAIIFLLLLGAGAQASEKLTFVTEEYRPFSYIVDGKAEGATVDQVRAIAKGAGVDAAIKIMPWARAYRLALVNTTYCVFATAHTPSRDRLFKWIEPIGEGRSSLVRLAGTPVFPRTKAEARALRIGVQRGDVATDVLSADGFDRLDVSADFETTLRKLLTGRIPLMVVSDNALAELQVKHPRLERVMTIFETRYGIACNRNMPDDLVDRLNESLANLNGKSLQ